MGADEDHGLACARPRPQDFRRVSQCLVQRSAVGCCLAHAAVDAGVRGRPRTKATRRAARRELPRWRTAGRRLGHEALDRGHQSRAVVCQFLATASHRGIDDARQILRSQFVNRGCGDAARELELARIQCDVAVIEQDEDHTLRAEMVRDDVGRDVAYPRRTGSHAIRQVDCREGDDGLFNPAIKNGEVSGGESADRLPIPIEHRDVDLDEVRGGAEDGRLLGVAGRKAPAVIITMSRTASGRRIGSSLRRAAAPGSYHFGPLAWWPPDGSSVRASRTRPAAPRLHSFVGP